MVADAIVFAQMFVVGFVLVEADEPIFMLNSYKNVKKILKIIQMLIFQAFRRCKN